MESSKARVEWTEQAQEQEAASATWMMVGGVWGLIKSEIQGLSDLAIFPLLVIDFHCPHPIRIRRAYIFSIQIFHELAKIPVCWDHAQEATAVMTHGSWPAWLWIIVSYK